MPGSAVIEYGKIKTFVSSAPVWTDEKEFGIKNFHLKLTDNFLNVSTENKHINGKISKGNLKLKIYDVYNVRTPASSSDVTFTINSNIFRTATSKVLYAINPSDTRAFLQGMNITFDSKEICFVGTDGQRLSEYKVKNISDLPEGVFLLKYDFVMGLRRLVDSGHQLIFEFDKHHVKVVFDNVMFWGRNVIGHEFPDYKSILQSFEHTVVMDKEILLTCLLPFIDVLNSDDNYRLTFSLVNGQMSLKCDVADFVYDGKIDFEDEFIIDVNGQFMIQTIEAIKDDLISINFSNAKGPIIFNSNNFEDQAGLIAPLRRR
jgi:DNA polymerase III sliding clamp (beta) subunit (PCNA family)